MIEGGGVVEAEASGETVGEAKWHAARELERLNPGVDRERIVFEVVSEGERGLLGVGTAPARVRAWAELTGDERRPAASPLAAQVRETLDRIATALGAAARISVTEDDEALHASVSAPASEVGLLIGRNGRTIDAIQVVVSGIAHRSGEEGRMVEVDAGGYRTRRRERLAATADRAARQVLDTGRPVTLPPMSSIERKIVHTELAGLDGIATRSEGVEPDRRVVVEPASAS